MAACPQVEQHLLGFINEVVWSLLLVLPPELLHLLPGQGFRAFLFRHSVNRLIWVDIMADPVLGHALVLHPHVAVDVHQLLSPANKNL